MYIHIFAFNSFKSVSNFLFLMKKRTFLFALAIIATLANVAFVNSPSKPITFKADVSKSSLTWLAKKVTGEHAGTVKLADGTLTLDGNKLTGGSFTMDMTSITCTDITDATHNGKLIGHLKSDDFFSVAKHPKASFKITKVEATTANAYNVTGDLTIKGITKPVTFPATVTISGGKAEAAAKITVDRTKYDIRYGSKSFFDNLGDKVIYDEFTIDLKLVAAK